MYSFSGGNESEKENMNYGIPFQAEKQKGETSKEEFRFPLADSLSWTSLGKLSLDENIGRKLSGITPDCNSLVRESNTGSNSTATESLFRNSSRLSNFPLPRRVPISEATIIDDSDEEEEDDDVNKKDEIKSENEDINKTEKEALPIPIKVNSPPSFSIKSVIKMDENINFITEKSYNKLATQTTQSASTNNEGAISHELPFTPFRTSNVYPFEQANSHLHQHTPFHQQSTQHQHQVQFMVPVTPSQFSALQQLPASDMIMVKNKAYYKLSLLGKGGSSKVYLAYENQKKCLLAIKCINLDVSDESVNGAYKNEIYLLQKLQHSDRIIKLYDFEFNTEKNCLYLVMEKGDADLSLVIRDCAKNGQITAEMIKFYWSEMLKTVAVIHKAGIIHSDLKPANFLLVGGRMKLIDFGIASSLQTDMTSVIKDVQVGTFNYMSPEAIQDTTQAQDYDGRRQPLFKINVKSDVWSLGCILYNLVYGKTPFQDIRQPVAKMQAIVNSDHAISFPDIPNKQLLDVMKKCLIRDQKQRLSIEELLEHPYLKETTKESSPNPSPLSSVMKQIESLTPNSVLKAERKLSLMAEMIRVKKLKQFKP